jgi:addiction module HigA family antidote
MFRFDLRTAPPSTGEMMRRKLLDDFNLTQAQPARAIGISRPRLNMMLKGRCSLSPEIALRIGRVFGISPEFWLRVRADFELFEEAQRIASLLERLPQIQPPRRAFAHAFDWRAAA